MRLWWQYGPLRSHMQSQELELVDRAAFLAELSERTNLRLGALETERLFRAPKSL